MFVCVENSMQKGKSKALMNLWGDAIVYPALSLLGVKLLSGLMEVESMTSRVLMSFNVTHLY